MRKFDIILLGYIILAKFTQIMLSYYDINTNEEESLCSWV